MTANWGDAAVFAGEECSAPVLGGLSAQVRALTGKITATVWAIVDDAVAIAGDDVTAAVSGGRNATAASLGKVTAPVDAFHGDAFVLAHGGAITAPVSAAGSVSAIARSSVLGEVTAGLDAFVFTLESAIGSITAGRDVFAITGRGVSGDVEAGRDVALMAGGSVGGQIEAQRHASIMAYGPVTGSVWANVGNASVFSWDSVSGGVSAGQDLFIFAGGGVRGSVTAGNDLAVFAYGTSSPFATSGRDAFVWTAVTSAGLITAGRDAAAISLGSSTMGLRATRDAYAMIFGDYQSSVIAGQDAFVMSFAGASASITAGRDAAVFSIDYAIGNIDAGRFASLVTWGTAAGPYGVDGEEGAFAWVYGDLNGGAQSANGDVTVVVYGNAVGAEKVVAAGNDSMLFVVGDVLGIAEAGNDLLVNTLGNIWGTITAGQDLWAITEGSITASVTAGRDVLDVWARGDITGTITAGRNIGHYDQPYYVPGSAALPTIFSYGDISAAILATNEEDGGQISGIAAWGSISGRIEASASIGGVRSGEAVSATIIAPQIGPIVENDAMIHTDYPYPASIKADILAEAAGSHASVLSERALAAAAIDEALADFADARDDALDQLHDALDAARKAAVEANAQARASAQQSLDAQRAATQAAFRDLQANGRALVKSAREEADRDRTMLLASRNHVRALRDAAFDEAKKQEAVEKAELDKFGTALTDARTKSLAVSGEQRAIREKNFDEMVAAIKKVYRDRKLEEAQRKWEGSWWSWVPVIGSLGSAYLAHERGQTGWAIFHTACGVLDLYGVGKGLARLSSGRLFASRMADAGVERLASGGGQRAVGGVAASGFFAAHGDDALRLVRAPGTSLVPRSTVGLGKWGEARLAHDLGYLGVKPSSAFRTSLGNRFFDRLVNGVAHEAKAGINVGLTWGKYGTRTQALKDAELIAKGRIGGAVWHFYQGAQQKLLDFLTQHGIQYVVH